MRIESLATISITKDEVGESCNEQEKIDITDGKSIPWSPHKVKYFEIIPSKIALHLQLDSDKSKSEVRVYKFTKEHAVPVRGVVVEEEGEEVEEIEEEVEEDDGFELM